MKPLLAIGLILLLCFVFYQDLKYRAVYWFLFPLLLVMSYFYLKNEINQQSWLLNTAFVLIQLLGIWGYFSLKAKKPINFVNSHLGLGDILFFGVLILWFTPINFILFFTGSLVITLISLLLFKRNSLTVYKVPLAGIHALLLAIIVSLKETAFPQILTKNWVSL